MVNKINGSKGSIRSINPKNTRAKSSVSPDTTHSPAAQSEQVNISFASRQIEALMKMIDDVPPIDVSKVEFIKEQIRTGQYEITAAKIAEKMVSYKEYA